jgi:hypothetical protein
MLKWENYVIQQEKMKKLREDIDEAARAQALKIKEIQLKHRQLVATLAHFHKICQILEDCQSGEQPQSLANSGGGNGSNANNDENSFDVAIQSSSLFQDSFEDEQKEREAQELAELKEKITAFTQKAEQAEKQVGKFE